MAKSTKKQSSGTYQHTVLFFVLATAVFLCVVFLLLAQIKATWNKGSTPVQPVKSKLAYVDGDDATNHVANFYKQYIDIKTTSAFRNTLIQGYGDKNLAFYSQYYLHGFDPVTCSFVMPSKVATSLSSTGPVANVNATEYFPDGSIMKLKSTVVLNDKLAIDSITCPGALGNLPPAAS